MFDFAPEPDLHGEELYAELASAAAALVEGERDPVANMANLAALIWQFVPQLNWAGFYRLVEGELVVGADGAETGLGATAWLTVDKPLGIDIFGLRPAYRISYFDPSSSFADDAVLENTLALRWDTPLQGLSLIVDATLLTEIGEGVRDLDNARGTALLQLEL